MSFSNLIFLSLSSQVSDFESFIGSLNDQGYLLKKGPRLYQLQTMWEDLIIILQECKVCFYTVTVPRGTGLLKVMLDPQISFQTSFMRGWHELYFQHCSSFHVKNVSKRLWWHCFIAVTKWHFIKLTWFSALKPGFYLKSKSDLRKYPCYSISFVKQGLDCDFH